MSTPDNDLPGRSARRQELPTSLSLLVRLRGQDDAAWREFVELYAPLVVRWCHRRGEAEHDVADVAQEVFAKVARGIQSFRKEAATDSLRGWLCRITHREIAQAFRRHDPALTPEGGSVTLERLQEHADLSGDQTTSGAEAQQEVSYLYHQAVAIARAEFTDETWTMFWRVIDGDAQTLVGLGLARWVRDRTRYSKSWPPTAGCRALDRAGGCIRECMNGRVRLPI